MPILDHHVAEFAASLPANLKLKGFTRKYLLKKVAEQWLPHDVVYRQKQGFPLPLDSWFRNEARELLRDHVNSTTITKRGIFKPEQIEKILSDHENGFADHGTFILTLLNLELWYRLFIDGSK